MQVELLAELKSTLPDDDTHPYRSGPWRPQTREYRAWDLDVEGAIPHDLNGVYLRNTENPLHPPIRAYHPFDGDGMVHSMSFSGGDVVYHNRFVRTEGLLAEQAAGESLWAGVAESAELARRSPGWGARGGMKDASSTDVVVHGGVALSSFWQCGDLYRLDPRTLEDLGRETWNGATPAGGVSAHPKVDWHTGELLFFGYDSSPLLQYGVVSPEGVVTHRTELALPGVRAPHDLAFTEHYTVFNDFPMFPDEAALASGRWSIRYHPDIPSRFGVLPRHGSGDGVQWFEAEPTYVLHFVNAYEDGPEIVLDGYFQQQPSPPALPGMTAQAAASRYLDLHALGAVAHRWRFDLRTGRTREERLSDRILEFGTVNGYHGGRRHRFSYPALGCEGWFGFRGFAKHDHDTGRIDLVELPDGVFASEVAMAPRVDPGAEDDGYLLTFTSDLAADRSECLVFDAADPMAGPVARIALPERISSGTHACWAPG